MTNNELIFENKIEVSDDAAIFYLINIINCLLYDNDRTKMIGPNEAIHLVHWIRGYNSGITTIKRMIRYLEEKMYEGKKNRGLYAVKDALTRKGWLSFDDDYIKIENKLFTIASTNCNLELDIKFSKKNEQNTN